MTRFVFLRITFPLCLFCLFFTCCSGDYYSEQDGDDTEVDAPDDDASLEDAMVDKAGDGDDEDPEEDAPPVDAIPEAIEDAAEEEPAGPTSCDFDYDEIFTYSRTFPLQSAPAPVQSRAEEAGGRPFGPDRIAYHEPLPPATFTLPAAGGGRAGGGTKDEDIVMPDYSDDMPLFERGAAWTGETRCYETPAGVRLLTEPEAYDMVRAIAELTTGVSMNDSAEFRSVVGIRGAYPGRFFFNGNLPDRFNDTIVLLWVDEAGARHVREFPVTNDVGARDFGENSSSFLRPNRRYDYVNGWHRSTYNALHIGEDTYRVMDDTNNNGHWDSDRNGWLPPAGDPDHERYGSGHNIHVGSVDAPLGSATVGAWSAGCQVIPGMANWTEFITNAWTGLGDRVDYFLVDVRDIDRRVWEGPCEPDGTHACPYRVETSSFSHPWDTTLSAERLFDMYNCSDADESGPEVVYLMMLDAGATVDAAVGCAEPVDIDVHFLDADDANACMERGHESFSIDVGPGRYFITADTYVSGGTELGGAYSLSVNLR
ncbi:MAG: hypothetical protein ABIJ56_24495 [Pseudomonadota bacterium]